RTQSGVVTGFIYDTRDQLVEVQNNGTLVETYDFSYDGLRTRKSGSGSLFRYVYDGRSLLLETDLGGNTISKYEWGSDRLLSLNHATEGRVHYLFDGLGSPVALSKPDGTLQARYLWDAWGNLRSEVGASSSIFGFTGYQRDAATGFMYAGARFYDPEIGRFLNEDPFGGDSRTPPSLHRYLYAFQNPTVWRDPSGRVSALVNSASLLDEAANEAVNSLGQNATGAEVLKAGATKAALRTASALVSGANWLANRVLTDVTPSAGLQVQKEAQQERQQTLEKIRAAAASGVQRLQEDTLGTVQKVMEAPDREIVKGLGAAMRAASGDPQAQANLVSTTLEIGAAFLPLGGAGNLRRAESTVGLLDELGTGARAAAGSSAPIALESAQASFAATESIAVSGVRAIDRAQSYEAGVRGLYGDVTFEQRQFVSRVGGELKSGVADSVATAGAANLAVEAKYVGDWSKSLRNPSSSSGGRPWAVAEQNRMVEQAQKYAGAFEKTVYHTNSVELANHYTQAFNEAGVTRYQFVISPEKR
ncbi:MAG: RHS repeat-associated core domain-containing protein, partial [bacterium]